MNKTERKLFTDCCRAIIHIREQIELKRFGLVFGAGISCQFGFPTWKNLIQQLANHSKINGTDLVGISDNVTNISQMLYQLDKGIDRLRSEIDDLSKLVDKESKEDKMAAIINKINLQMSNWVKSLDVEHEDALIRFDISKLTLIADSMSSEKSIPLYQMGSGANWVSYHLLIHFALHQYFIQANRPIPHFLMIDQPTQVYFPPEKDINNDGIILESSDEIAVKKIFDFIIDTSEKLNSKFQVIITDHAYLRTDKFEQCVREIWRNGTKLIPSEWLSDDNE